MNYHVLDATHLGGHRVKLRFRDGLTGEIDLFEALQGPIFEPLLDEREFARFRLDSRFHTICWRNGADFAPEFLYQRVVTSGPGMAKPA